VTPPKLRLAVRRASSRVNPRRRFSSTSISRCAVISSSSSLSRSSFPNRPRILDPISRMPIGSLLSDKLQFVVPIWATLATDDKLKFVEHLRAVKHAPDYPRYPLPILGLGC